MFDFLTREFVSQESRSFRFQVGKVLASGLAGFIAGVFFSSIVWGTVVYIYKALSQ